MNFKEWFYLNEAPFQKYRVAVPTAKGQQQYAYILARDDEEAQRLAKELIRDDPRYALRKRKEGVPPSPEEEKRAQDFLGGRTPSGKEIDPFTRQTPEDIAKDWERVSQDPEQQKFKTFLTPDIYTFNELLKYILSKAATQKLRTNEKGFTQLRRVLNDPKNRWMFDPKEYIRTKKDTAKGRAVSRYFGLTPEDLARSNREALATAYENEKLLNRLKEFFPLQRQKEPTSGIPRPEPYTRPPQPETQLGMFPKGDTALGPIN